MGVLIRELEGEETLGGIIFCALLFHFSTDHGESYANLMNVRKRKVSSSTGWGLETILVLAWIFGDRYILYLYLYFHRFSCLNYASFILFLFSFH